MNIFDPCEKCVTDRGLCDRCSKNPKYRDYPHKSLFQAYKPTCPRGYTDCIRDPAYVKFYYPEWYKELFGDKTPEEAAHEENGCYDRFKNDPDMKYYCYDDEDK